MHSATGLNGGMAGGYSGITRIIGGPGAGTTGTANTLTGASGNDLITGGMGEDQITGADGNDSLEGLQHNDVINGDAGNDTIKPEPATTPHKVELATTWCLAKPATQPVRRSRDDDTLQARQRQRHAQRRRWHQRTLWQRGAMTC